MGVEWEWVRVGEIEREWETGRVGKLTKVLGIGFDRHIMALVILSADVSCVHITMRFAISQNSLWLIECKEIALLLHK